MAAPWERTLSVGPETKLALAREAQITTHVWPSAAPALVSYVLPLLDAEPDEGIEKAFQATRSSPYGYTGSAVLGEVPRLNTTLDWRYGHFETLAALALGASAKRIDGAVLPEDLGNGAFRHLYEVADSLTAVTVWGASDGVLVGDGLNPLLRKMRRATLALSRGISVWEYRSALVDQLSLASTDEGRMTCAVNWLAHSLSRTSTVNTRAWLYQLPPNGDASILFTDLRVRLAPMSLTVPLDSGDDVGVTGWSTTLQNNLAVVHSPAQPRHASEFDYTTFPLVSGSLTLPRYRADALFAAYGANTTYMLESQFTGPLIPGTAVNSRVTLYVPALKFTQVSAPLNRGAANQPLLWYAQIPEATPASFPTTNHYGPLVIEITTDNAEHPLLAIAA